MGSIGLAGGEQLQSLLDQIQLFSVADSAYCLALLHSRYTVYSSHMCAM